MSPRIKIRGIYSTALTKLALDSGFQVVQPSEKMRERFCEELPDQLPYEILVRDRDDLQGIEARGEADHVCKLLVRLQELLLDAVIVSILPSDDSEPLVVANLELPGGAKEKLDAFRSAVVPTLRNHHRLKIIAPEQLEAAEAEFYRRPDDRCALENMLFRKAILGPLVEGGQVRLEHIRPSGRPMRPRLGVLQSATPKRVVFRREFSTGRYDGLDLPIQQGDYCLTEIREGDWCVKHSYYSKQNLGIGDYYNINTPTELYPYGARYVDLELDVIQRAAESAFAIDREKFEMLVRKGCIGKDLENKVLVTSEQLLRRLNRGKAKESAGRQ
ncbi:MAG: DUF402 domain-containing protein [Syntrophobacteraceae bacterium]|nr:DUF402 domain-containing protein [Syntrophobacteraceae bacterium]